MDNIVQVLVLDKNGLSSQAMTFDARTLTFTWTDSYLYSSIDFTNDTVGAVDVYFYN